MSGEIPFEPTLVKVFGSLKNARKKAGLEFTSLKLTNSKEKQIKSLQEFRIVHGRNPRPTDCYRRLLPYSYDTYNRNFGIWEKVLQIANL